MDLDDDYLDGCNLLILDVLDEFNEKPSAPPAPESMDEDFMKLLQQNMSQMMESEELDSAALLEGLQKAVQTQAKPVNTEKVLYADHRNFKIQFLIR